MRFTLIKGCSTEYICLLLSNFKLWFDFIMQKPKKSSVTDGPTKRGEPDVPEGLPEDPRACQMGLRAH